MIKETKNRRSISKKQKFTLNQYVRLFRKKILFLQKLLIWKNDINNTRQMKLKIKFNIFLFKKYSVRIFFYLINHNYK